MQNLYELEKSLVDIKKPEFRPGDTVRVHLKIIEGAKERIQVFQGVVIAINLKMNRSTFVVRKISAGGFGVERILPLYSPSHPCEPHASWLLVLDREPQPPTPQNSRTGQ